MVEVLEEDELNSPIKVKLIAHSKNRDDSDDRENIVVFDKNKSIEDDLLKDKNIDNDKDKENDIDNDIDDDLGEGDVVFF